MATAIPTAASVELFYSYAHSDEPLCRKLQKHLAGLKRSGLIRDWYDCQIQPGSEWDSEIRAAMERAGIILLLISADFLASPYIYEVELPFALQQHGAGRAKVIPVLLRPVEWHDSPFAKLQVLPSGARPITLWPNRDEAFADVAGRLRELLYRDRLGEITRRSTSPPPPTPLPAVTQPRVLDAAIASSVVTDEPTDLVIMVRNTDSQGLKAILQLDRTYSPTPQDVQSKPFELEFPADPASGKLLPATLEIALESPGFDPPTQRKKIRVPSTGDSDVTVFMLTPQRVGTLRLNLQLISSGIEIGSRALVTTSVAASEAGPALAYGVTSMPIRPSVFDEIDFGSYYDAAPASAPLPQSAPSPASPPPSPRSARPTLFPFKLAASALAICLVSVVSVTYISRPAAQKPVASVEIDAYRGSERNVVPAARPLVIHSSAPGVPEGQASVEITDKAGAVLWKGKVNVRSGQFEVKLPGLRNPGSYLLRLLSTKNELLYEHSFAAK